MFRLTAPKGAGGPARHGLATTGMEFKMASTATERSLQGRLGGHTKWAKTSDRTSATAPGRAAFEARFKPPDPDGTMDPVERAQRTASNRAAFFADLALKSAKSRRRASEARKRAAAEEARVRVANTKLIDAADAVADAADAELREAELAAEQAATAPTP
jgi:hypothetical protein